MAAFTINGGAITDWDSLSGGSVNATLDTYAISNGTTLRINTDSYQCTGHTSARGSLDTVTFSGIGGRLLVDPTAVRVVPYSSGTGNVPAIGTTISQGGVSGDLLGVWSSWQSEPTAAGSAMPASGWIKLKSISGGQFSVGALTGIGASATSPDVQGWIEVRGADTATISVPRIGKFEVDQAWFELGLTNGTAGQILECPTTGTTAGTFPGCWIETSSGSGVFERFVGCGTMANSASTPTDERGKIIWQTTSGIRIGSDGVNTVGYLPPSGCRVRIPAVILTCCTRTSGSGSGPRVLPNVTLGNRQEFVTTSAGDIQINGAVMHWYGNFLQAYRAKVYNSAFADTLVQQELASPVDVDNVIVGPTQMQLNNALNMLSCHAGGQFKNALLARATLATTGVYVNVCNTNDDVLFENVKSQTLLNRGNATTGTWTAATLSRCVFTNCTNIGGRMLLVAVQKCKFNNLHYVDQFSGTTLATFGQYALEFSTGGSGNVVDGMDFLGLPNVHPYSGLARFVACYSMTLRNIGTYTNPLDFGSVNACAYAYIGQGDNSDTRLQRVYVKNTRTGLYTTLNSDVGFVAQDVAGDYSDSSVIDALNSIGKGIGILGATTGRTSVYGTHWLDGFMSLTTGRLEILGNEPTVASATQCAITGGSPQFNSAGSVGLTAVGDQVTWEMPYFARGHTATANSAPGLVGTNTANLGYEFQYDLGPGYSGSWLTLSQANWYSVGAIDPAIGIRIKVRATCVTANAGNLLTNLRLNTETSDTAQSTNQYPLDEHMLTLTGLVSGSDIVILSAGTEIARVQVDALAATAYDYVYSTPEHVDIAVYKSGQIPFFIRDYPLGEEDATLPVAQVVDVSYVE